MIQGHIGEKPLKLIKNLWRLNHGDFVSKLAFEVAIVIFLLYLSRTFSLLKSCAPIFLESIILRLLLVFRHFKSGESFNFVYYMSEFKHNLQVLYTVLYLQPFCKCSNKDWKTVLDDRCVWFRLLYFVDIVIDDSMDIDSS